MKYKCNLELFVLKLFGNKKNRILLAKQNESFLKGYCRNFSLYINYEMYIFKCRYHGDWENDEHIAFRKKITEWGRRQPALYLYYQGVSRFYLDEVNYN